MVFDTTTTRTTTTTTTFEDRIDAGRQLADLLTVTLSEVRHRREDIVVVGLPQGGVPVAAEVAAALDAPLDVIVVRKLGVPFQQELAMGAIGEGGVVVLDDELVGRAHVTSDELGAIVERERTALVARVDRLRRSRARCSLRGKHVVIVDDGIATGSTARAACQVARSNGAIEVTLAVPVAPAGWIDRLGSTADRYLAVRESDDFRAVGQFYRDFGPTTDETAVAILDAHHHGHRTSGLDHRTRPDGTDVRIPVTGVSLDGHLVVPPDRIGVVVFAHGSGSSRHSPRNRFVADFLVDAGLATLLFDLLTPDEERRRTSVFDIELLTDRLVDVVRWTMACPDLEGVPIGLFGASTGAAAALAAAAAAPEAVKAVVVRGGRPDLAGSALDSVRTPTLLVVGGADTVVLGLNRRARERLGEHAELSIVPGATHLFEEPGALEMVADLARDWFLSHLPCSWPT